VVKIVEAQRHPGGPSLRSRGIWAVGAAVVAVMMVVLVTWLEGGPHKIARVSVTNDTPYDLTIELRGRPEGPITPLGSVPAKHSFDFPDVFDQGPTWQVHVVSQGQVGADLSISRAELAAHGWRLGFGADVTARLRQAGLQPSPGSGG
jgi:hypothetical protein